MLRLQYIDFEGSSVQLVDEASFLQSANTYTVIVGKNGLGKSRLLAQIAKERISHSYDPEPSAWPKAYHFSASPKVIAISTSPFDKFPSPTRKKDRHSKNYRYVGMRGESMFAASSSISLLSSVARGLLAKLTDSRRNADLLGVFKSLGFNSRFEFVFKPSFSLKSNPALNPKVRSFLFRAEGQEFLIDERLAPAMDRMPQEDLPGFQHALNNAGKLFSKRTTFGMSVDFRKNMASIEENVVEPHEINSISMMMDFGLVRLMDIRLRKKGQGEISLRSASSGEQCMLVLMLGIASYIEDGSIILIDEPEISLHPEWQEDFMELLGGAFRHFRRCQFIIATHSPQITSRLKDHGAFIYSLGRNALYSASEFTDRSADFQLAELFDSPGMMNEYISRLSFNAVARMRSRGRVDSEIQNDLHRLARLRNSVDRKDPTLGLIDSVLEMATQYGNDK